MSQAGGNSTTAAGSGAIQLTTDSGIAASVASNINLLGIDSTANNDNGITTTGAGDTANVVITNRAQGTGSTVGAVTSDIVTFAMGATPRTCAFEFRVAAFESTTPAGAGYSVFGAVRTTGAAATLVGTPDIIVNEEAALSACDVDLVVSANNAILRVTGTAGLTVSWSVVGLYTQAS